MKRLILTSFFILAVVVSTFAAVTIRYYNKDSKKHTFKVKMSGSTKEVVFDSSRTSSVTIQGNATECIIITDCGEVKVKSGDQIEIKDGCITIK
ncbi:MAG: hypothetical protein R3277_07385 [Brumimicrobium sp.]|nr:hypothetical protein [Brumimicrobium sp.]